MKKVLFLLLLLALIAGCSQDTKKWKVEVRESALDSSKIVWIRLPPEFYKNDNWNAGYFSVSCNKERLTYPGFSLGPTGLGSQMMKYAIDDGPVQQIYVTQSPVNSSAVTIEFPEGIKFLKELLRHKKLGIQLTSNRGTVEESVFDITAFREVYTSVMAHNICSPDVLK